MSIDWSSIFDLIGATAIVLSVVFIAYQFGQIRKQRRGDAMQSRIAMRIETWSHQLDTEALHSAKEKFFDHELYRKDVGVHDLDELSWRERQAFLASLQIELAYFQNLFFQRELDNIVQEHSLPLDYMLIFSSAPARRVWKDVLRLSHHFPDKFIRHVDSVVKKYDEVEKRMETDQDAEFNAVVQEVFGSPAPPNWLDN